ncbi:amiloride-sensitive sodium channel subunit beta-like [Centruroides vittatus]|uniref:amiloride-sensitive sodium channel subunit beta-like n=1 Tax=Centruroides vittatus TaxID=120091 RepID=UPI00350EDD14
MEMKHEANMILPSVTVCNNNRYKRSKYCPENIRNCQMNINESFSSQCSYICKKLDSHRLSTHTALKFCTYCNRSQLILYGHSFHSLVRKLEIIQADNHSYELMDDFLHVTFSQGSTCQRNCYVLNSVVDKMNFTLKNASVQTETRQIMKLFLDLEPEEYIDPTERVEAEIAVHSPFEIVNPFIKGFRAKPGYVNYVNLNVFQKTLLPSPYSTNCINYLQRWKEEGRVGPYTWEMCVHHCKLNRTVNNCKCALKQTVYPHDSPYCQRDDEACVKKQNLEECYSVCKPECNSINYRSIISSREFSNDIIEIYECIYPKQTRSSIRKRAAVVVFSLDRPEFFVYKYVPKYELIEVFSYIGGYMGMWLGISLFVVFDFVERCVVNLYEMLDNWRTRRNVLPAWIRTELADSKNLRNDNYMAMSPNTNSYRSIKNRLRRKKCRVFRNKRMNLIQRFQ